MANAGVESLVSKVTPVILSGTIMAIAGGVVSIYLDVHVIRYKLESLDDITENITEIREAVSDNEKRLTKVETILEKTKP